MVGNQDDVAAGKSSPGKTPPQQISQEATMHNQRDKAEYSEEHVGAARDFISNLQCEHRASEQEEHAYPSQADRAHLIPQNQQFGWSVHSADFHQRNEQSRDENCRAEVLADIAGRIPLLKMI